MGIVVNDTLQTYDPKIYAVGECAAHRGTAYGLVAPLFEQAKVCANHLAQFGIGRYAGSVTSTKLKVTGIDVFSAGNFTGGENTEEIVLSDPAGGVYKKLVIQGDHLVGAVMYGDTADGAWYFQLLRDKQNIAEIRDHLMFGASGVNHVGDVGHQGQSKAAAMPDTAEVCGCNGVCKGHYRQGDHRERPLHRWTRCASTPRPRRRAVPVPDSSSRSSPRPLVVRTSQSRARTSRLAAAPTTRTVSYVLRSARSTC